MVKYPKYPIVKKRYPDNIMHVLERMGMEQPDAGKFPGWCEHCLPLPQVQCGDCQWDDDLMRPDEFIHQKVWKQDKN